MANKTYERPAVSVFSGAGGLDIGVDRAGFNTICSIESDIHCAATLRRNARSKAVWQVDIRAVSPGQVLGIYGMQPGDVQLLYGSPPCQPPDQTSKCDGSRDAYDLLIDEIARFAEVLRPPAILVEQMPAFLRSRLPGRQLLVERLNEEFRTLGYDMHATVMNSVRYGVAQSRRRAVFVCVPSGQKFRFPSRAVSAPSVGDVLRGLPKPVARNERSSVANHIDVTPPRDRERISFVPEGSWLARVSNAPADIKMNLTAKDTTKFRRLDRKLASLAISSGHMLFHPREDRYITPREAARIQGFPDKYVLIGPVRGRGGRVRDLDQHRQVAIAVPPPLAGCLARSIRGALGLS